MRSRRGARAWLGAAAVAALGLVVGVAPSASAAPQDWAGSEILTTASAATTTPVQASFTRTSWGDNPRLLVRTTISAPADQPSGCQLAQATPPTNVSWVAGRFVTEATLSTNCNGTYGLLVSAALQNRSCVGQLCDSYRTVDTFDLTGTIAISAPGPDVNARVEDGTGRAVVIRWDEPEGLPPDFLGYRVQRQSAKGSWATIATLDAPKAPTSFTDADPPAAGGDITYRVLSRRAGPDGEVMSTGGSPATATVEPSPDGSGGTTGDGGTTGGGAAGDPSGDGSAGGSTSGGSTTAGGGSTSSGGAGRPNGRVAAPRVGITGAFLPPLLQPRVPTVAGASTTTTVDDGFDESLPYEPGEEDPVLPDDEMASIVTGEAAGRGMAIPIATALVLAVWAVHLRVLARAARPT